ncbi:hypothetical protein KJS94_13615 [Flavihumibacter rivuli]|uniref:hypothetical protein n=1 Tax=Flavihumibacter rivuli TaxID=2838156 RepID=UPI001BDF1069|nr:hypothetical protein [Flavihumibacter rivuli]ULQ55682.1 hypothetical protein KJS94_13615 [Flavihumibacter rivuli]
MEDYKNLSEEEMLQAENDFLKMKMMLEKGAMLGGPALEGQFGAQVENFFLRRMMEFEDMLENCPQVKVFDKLGRPDHIPPVDAIPDEELDEAWESLNGLLLRSGVELWVDNPSVGKRELYRFVVEELFEMDMDDVRIPGMYQVFCYDEFYPDPLYSNSRIAEEECIRQILHPPLYDLFMIWKEGLRLNEHRGLSGQQFIELIQAREQELVEMRLKKCWAETAVMEGDKCVVRGKYALPPIEGETERTTRNWEVVMEQPYEGSMWYVTSVVIEGISF